MIHTTLALKTSLAFYVRHLVSGSCEDNELDEVEVGPSVQVVNPVMVHVPFRLKFCDDGEKWYDNGGRREHHEHTSEHFTSTRAGNQITVTNCEQRLHRPIHS